MVRLLVIRSLLLTCCELAGDARGFLRNLEDHRIALVDLRCDLAASLPTSSRLIVWNGLTLPPGRRHALVGVLAGDERHLLRAILDLGFLVVERDDRGRGDDVGVAAGAPAASARISAAQLKPPATICARCPRVRPLGRLATVSGFRTPWRIWPRPVPSTGCDEAAGGQVRLPSAVAVSGRSASSTARSMALSTDISTRMVLDQHLGAADVEAVHDGHHRAHDLGRCGHDECVGLRLRPDRDAAVHPAAAAADDGRCGAARDRPRRAPRPP